MKTTFLLATIIIASTFTINAQTTQKLKQVLELKMPKTANDNMPGTRGASVLWHPVQKKYYAVFAGNMGYPLAVFDGKGKRLSDDDLVAMMDTRGLWYDPSTKLVTANAYSDNGWFTYKLDPKGIPTDVDILQEGMNQPDAQSVGVYNPAAKKILFQHGGFVYTYNSDGSPQDSLIIHFGVKKKDGAQGGSSEDETYEDYNYTSLIYTGMKNQELGFLNIEKKQIELYDIQNGFLTKIVPLPETASTEASFNFSYANGIYWLFDIDNRKWVGYK
jgi:hypothetical protein